MSNKAYQIDLSSLVASMNALNTQIGNSSKLLTAAVQGFASRLPQLAPGGRLTASATSPLPTQVESATEFYYLPYSSAIVPIWNGTLWTFATLPPGGLSNSILDATQNPAAMLADQTCPVYVWNNNGTLQLIRGPALANTATNFLSQLSYANGIATNAVAIPKGPAAGFGTFVGSVGTYAGAPVYYMRYYSTTTADLLVGLMNEYNCVTVPLQLGPPSNVLSASGVDNNWAAFPARIWVVRSATQGLCPTIAYGFHYGSGSTVSPSVNMYPALFSFTGTGGPSPNSGQYQYHRYRCALATGSDSNEMETVGLNFLPTNCAHGRAQVYFYLPGATGVVEQAVDTAVIQGSVIC